MQPSDLDQWLDSQRIVRLVTTYFRLLDEQDFDEWRFHEIFHDDATIVRPDGSETIGPHHIAASHARNFARFESSQHLLTGHDVQVTGDIADLRFNLVAIHLWKDRPEAADLNDRAFTAGGVVTARLTRLPEGWRITQLQNRVVWRTGYFGDMKPSQ
ncbi:nuclear transport factor 2 family protein [Gordonia hankookensis]|uniref:Nuclear transport factor 2 family protein n=1 Tax=Gordonia hankookensis TaxID=589403 RepID=A0ABR7WI74_9ACTN|nr:nuclear transport factor 2 family protein [Gordonia hankookensis]MBD1322462.1 nuclear transport factor 2 family protein [Gordonia hankookensis]